MQPRGNEEDLVCKNCIFFTWPLHPFIFHSIASQKLPGVTALPHGQTRVGIVGAYAPCYYCPCTFLVTHLLTLEDF